VTHLAALDDLRADGGAIQSRSPDHSHDAVGGVLPKVVVQPASREEVAAALRWADEHRLSLVIRGRGSKLGWGATPAAIDVLLDLSRLDRILQHQAGDLTVTVEAGARLADVNGQLRQRGQWLPLDPPFADATIGGLLATNDSGPSRHRFGTPRDLVIGIEVATVDGNLAKAGGKVVKNVAGYDLSKIMSGSFGALAAITSATFKLSPVAASSRTIVVPGLDAETMARIAETFAASQLEPSAFDLHVRAVHGGRQEVGCTIRFASFPAVVDAEIDNSSARIATVHSTFQVIGGDLEHEPWSGYRERPWQDPGIVVRASWLPARLRDMLTMVGTLARDATLEVVGRVGVGAGLFRIDGSRDAQVAIVARMRESNIFGNVVVLRAPSELGSREWVWGSALANPIAVALKRELDPHGILGAGRGPI
jgi:glycolate oxidase FAD binding subunit